MAPLVETDTSAGLATVTVANPPVNALSDPVLEALEEAAASLRREPGLRAVVLTGAGERTFVAGADLNQFAAALGNEAEMEGHVALTRRVFAAWAELPVPTIAAVGGHAVGGGLELALACDLIVVDRRARLGTPEITLGLIPGAGASQRLPRRVGQGLATRMLLLGDLLKAEEALERGLVDYVCDEGGALATAQALAARIGSFSSLAVSSAKRAVRAATLPLEEGLAIERDLFLTVAAGADAREGVRAFIEKREPEYGNS